MAARLRRWAYHAVGRRVGRFGHVEFGVALIVDREGGHQVAGGDDFGIDVRRRLLTAQDGRMGSSWAYLERPAGGVHETHSETPGRAIYALCLLHEQDPSGTAWLSTARRIGRYRLVPDRNTESRTPWDIIGLSMLYLAIRPEETQKASDYDERMEFCTGAYVHAGGLLAAIDRAYELGTVVERKQTVKFHWPGHAPYPDYVGGFADTDPPDVANASVRLSALAAAYKVAIVKEAAREQRAVSFRNVARDVVPAIACFIMRQQFGQGGTFYVPNGRLVDGAFRTSPDNFEVRLSTCAQAMTALMDCITVMEIRRLEVPEQAGEQPAAAPAPKMPQ